MLYHANSGTDHDPRRGSSPRCCWDSKKISLGSFAFLFFFSLLFFFFWLCHFYVFFLNASVNISLSESPGKLSIMPDSYVDCHFYQCILSDFSIRFESLLTRKNETKSHMTVNNNNKKRFVSDFSFMLNINILLV